MTIRNIFYIGIFGKIETIYYWLKYHRKTPFNEYLEFPVTYDRDFLDDAYYFYNIDFEKELEELLEKELTKANEKIND